MPTRVQALSPLLSCWPGSTKNPRWLGSCRWVWQYSGSVPLYSGWPGGSTRMSRWRQLFPNRTLQLVLFSVATPSDHPTPCRSSKLEKSTGCPWSSGWQTCRTTCRPCRTERYVGTHSMMAVRCTHARCPRRSLPHAVLPGLLPWRWVWCPLHHGAGSHMAWLPAGRRGGHPHHACPRRSSSARRGRARRARRGARTRRLNRVPF